VGHSLLAFDTDRIKDYVFATDTLREIRGASALLDELNRGEMAQEVTAADPSAWTVYANGGSGLFVIDEDSVAEAQGRVARRYRERSRGAASITGVSVPLPAAFDPKKDKVVEFTRQLQYALRLAKDVPPDALSLPTLPFLRPCDSCGEQPAAASEPNFGDPILICEACRERRRQNDGLWERLRAGGAPDGIPPDDFGQLGELSRPRGYLGLLYADGNGMGKIVAGIRTLPELQRFATGADAALTGATADAISTHLPPRNGSVPCQPLFLGGDDLVMVTGADSALRVAITLAEQFSERSQQETGHRLTLSVGVIIAHARFPFRILLRIAESALKFAKQAGASRKLADRTLVNFLVISSANHLDFDSYYHESLAVPAASGRPALLRTLRPYAPAELRRLLNTAVALRTAPHGRIQALGECPYLSRQRAILEGLTILHRWRAEAQGGARVREVQAVLDLVDAAGPGTSLFPWRSEPNEWRTPVLDLAEVFEFAGDVRHAAPA